MRRPVLDRGAARKLAARAARGDIAARDALIVDSLPFLYKVAHRLFPRARGMEIEDLVGHGVLGLIHALGKYKSSKGDFLSYAGNWARAYVGRAIEENFGEVTTPVYFPLITWKLGNRRHELQGAGLHAADINKRLAKEFGDIALEAERALHGAKIRLDAPVREGCRPTEAFLAQPATQHDEIEEKEFQERVERTLAGVPMTDRHRAILNRRLRPTRDDPAELHVLAAAFGVSRERIRQIEKRLIERLQAAFRESMPDEVAGRRPVRRDFREPARPTPPRSPAAKGVGKAAAAPVRRVKVAANGLRVGDMVPAYSGPRSKFVVWRKASDLAKERTAKKRSPKVHGPRAA